MFAIIYGLIALYSLYLYFPVGNTYDEIKLKANELKTPETIHNYLWTNISYEMKMFPVPVWKFWKTKVGDCTEVMNIEYFMLQHLDYKVKRCVGYLNNSKHHYVKYFDEGWKVLDKNVEGGVCI